MNHDQIEQNEQDRPAAADAGTGKRTYVKPGFRHESVFETMALACGKVSSTQSSCRAVRKAS